MLAMYIQQIQRVHNIEFHDLPRLDSTISSGIGRSRSDEESGPLIRNHNVNTCSNQTDYEAKITP